MAGMAAGTERTSVLEAHEVCVMGGKKTLLEGFDLVLKPGEVHALVGRNGAGKSTLLKVLAGMRAPRSGEVRVQGRLGALIGEPSFLPELSGRANVEYLAYALGVADPAKEARRVLDIVGLDEDAREDIAGDYSEGQKQRLGIALALVGDPAVLLLDEPFNFIDLEGVGSIREALRRLVAKRGVAILIASHVCDHVVGFADCFSFIAGGRLTARANAQEIDKMCERYVLLQTQEPERALAVLEQSGAGLHAMLDKVGGIRIHAKALPTKVLQDLAQAGVTVGEIRSYGESYEELFRRLSEQGR